MRKVMIEAPSEEPEPRSGWMDVARSARVEITSEDPAHPIEQALLPGHEAGWRAAVPGEQTIRLVFDEPARLTRIRLGFVERATERTQEFVLRWSPDGGRSYHDVVRQQYTFSPRGATSEVEEFRVDLTGVTAMELAIEPDQGRGEALATLAEWRLG
jgi:hypothetical protein